MIPESKMKQWQGLKNWRRFKKITIIQKQIGDTVEQILTFIFFVAFIYLFQGALIAYGYQVHFRNKLKELEKAKENGEIKEIKEEDLGTTEHSALDVDYFLIKRMDRKNKVKEFVEISLMWPSYFFKK